jgi:hypothetical protein
MLPAIDRREPLQAMLSLPEWLRSRLQCLGGTRERPTIPASSTLSGRQRAAIERRLSDIADVLDAAPAASLAREIGTLLTFYATASLDPHVATVKVGVYAQVLGKLPGWAVSETIRRWHAGEITGNTSFAPSPAVLKEHAEGLVLVASGQASALRRLLAAEVDEPPQVSDERRAAVLALVRPPRPIGEAAE